MSAPKEIIQLGPLEIRFLQDSDDTDGRLSLFEFIVPPGARVPAPHYHAHVDEAAYGLEGVLTMKVDGIGYDVYPGQSLFVPRGAVHHFVNNGTETTRTLAMLTPSLIGPAYFREIAALLATGGPQGPAKVAKVMAHHGLVAVAGGW